MFNLNKKVNKLRRNVKAISPVISVLLMIAVAVVASLVAYAWVMGYIGFQTAKTGQAIQIQSVAQDGTVYVQNVGSGTVTFSAPCLFVDGVGITGATTGPLTEGQTGELSAPAFTTGTYTIKVTAEGGTFSEVVKVFP